MSRNQASGSRFPGLALLVALGASSAAQSSPTFKRYNGPLRVVTLDAATGTITRGPIVRDRAATTLFDFYNLDLSGFVGADTGAGFCEWFDAGVKGATGNASDLMNSITFAYCSAKLTPASGGPGGAVKLGFYEGYTTFGGAPTTGVAAFTLTGLPGNSGSSSFYGGFRCHFIQVNFPGLISFADGPIGYSWKFLDVGTGTINPQGAVYAGTFPFLSCVTSCSGSIGGLDGQGMTDFIDQYCPPGFLRSTFTFGTSSGTFTSMSMAIAEVTDVPATVMTQNSTTFPNPDTLTATPAVVGQPWSASLTLGLGRAKSGSWILFFGAGSIAPPNGVPIAQFQSGLNFGSSKGGRMLLCAINPNGFSCTGVHTGVTASVSVNNCGGGSIPAKAALICNEWCAQAVVLGQVPGNGNARLSSMVKGLVGSTF